MLELTNLWSPDGKVTSDKKLICDSYQRYKDGNRDYCSHFSVILETASTFLIVFVRLILGKVGLDGFTGPRREIDIRHEFDLKVILKGLGCKFRFWHHVLIECASNN